MMTQSEYSRGRERLAELLADRIPPHMTYTLMGAASELIGDFAADTDEWSAAEVEEADWLTSLVTLVATLQQDRWPPGGERPDATKAAAQKKAADIILDKVPDRVSGQVLWDAFGVAQIEGLARDVGLEPGEVTMRIVADYFARLAAEAEVYPNKPRMFYELAQEGEPQSFEQMFEQLKEMYVRDLRRKQRHHDRLHGWHDKSGE